MAAPSPPTSREAEGSGVLEGVAQEEQDVARGRAAETPFVMIAAVATAVGMLVALALVLVVLAVWLT
jgi:hypothetical protein